VTPLGRLIAAQIAQAGPMRLSDYMALCLLHPEHGYYTGRDPLGAAGDFTTAPEISQMFGELAGLALAQAWLDQGRPAPFVLAELGPGRGTLMADVLRASSAVPGFRAAAEIWLVEASPVLRARQAAALADHAPRWASEVSALPDRPLFLLANEFFDALPIRQFHRSPEGWRERVVGLAGGAMAFGLSAPLTLPELAARADVPPGGIVEISPAARQIAAALAARIAARGGAALIVDYGAGPSLGDTFQAVRAHRKVDPLAEPGLADLTAHVDFAALAEAARAAAVTPPTPQGLWLERLGIAARAHVLARRLTGAALESHLAAHRRLTDAAEMGSLFKAIALHPHGSPPPPGFSP
jgi:SAM-dependent MidA family methyltransferase